jgi:hypothetical protein
VIAMAVVVVEYLILLGLDRHRPGSMRAQGEEPPAGGGDSADSTDSTDNEGPRLPEPDE